MKIFQWLVVLVLIKEVPFLLWVAMFAFVISFGVTFWSSNINGRYFNFEGIQRIATELYNKYDINIPVKVRQKKYQKKDLITPEGVHMIYINMNRGIIGRIFPLYYESRVIFTILDDIDNIRSTGLYGTEVNKQKIEVFKEIYEVLIGTGKKSVA